MSDTPGYIKNLKKESVVQSVINCLTEAMRNKELKPGDRIPPEPDLAASMGVARSSVREAIKILSYLGVLESKRSEGTFVCSGFQESMIDPMIYGIILNQDDSFDSLMELREMMEVGVMHIVITKATDEAIETLRGPLSTLMTACMADPPDLETVFHADDQFHQAINDLGGNQMVTKISNMVRALTYSMRHDSVEHMLGTGRADELYRAHERIFMALKERNAENLNHVIRSTYFVNGQALDEDTAP